MLWLGRARGAGRAGCACWGAAVVPRAELRPGDGTLSELTVTVPRGGRTREAARCCRAPVQSRARRRLTRGVIPSPGRYSSPPLLQSCSVITTVRKVRTAACSVRPGVRVSLGRGVRA